MKFKNILGKGEKTSIEHITSDFVSLASHQLRTPLSAVKWNTEILISQKPGKLNEKQKKYLEEIYRSNERAINLVNDLLDVSRIQEGSIHLDLRSTKVEDVIKETIDNMSDVIEAGKIHVDFQIKNGPLPKIEIDQEKLKRILSNLILNAVKYTPPEGKVSVTVERYPNFLYVIVSDSGVGISEIDQKKIFERFFRSPQAVKIAPDGTGLGLFITRALVEAMGGKIGFQSKPEKGSIFHLTLPINL